MVVQDEVTVLRHDAVLVGHLAEVLNQGLTLHVANFAAEAVDQVALLREELLLSLLRFASKRRLLTMHRLLLLLCRRHHHLVSRRRRPSTLIGR